MRNQVTGKYEVRKFINRTNEEIVGIGDTKEEAKADLKAKLAAYRADRTKQLQPTGELLPSPGYLYAKDASNRVTYRNHPDRKAQVLARPGLAEQLRVKRVEAKDSAENNE